MKRISALLLGLMLAACMQTNSITGRNQFITIPAKQDAIMGAQAFAEVSKNAPVLRKGAMADRVKRIGDRIARISDAPNMAWEFVVINEPVLNAWALPGGKIAIYRKMLDSFNTDAEIAAILGHEVAHAVLRHGAEQVSRAQLQQLIIVGLGVATAAATEDKHTTQLAMQLGTLAAAGFVALPHSRNMELEADDIGTVYMARAGYDPRFAIAVWQKMKNLKEGAEQPPTWLSTHPNDDKRIERLTSKMGFYQGEYHRAIGSQ